MRHRKARQWSAWRWTCVCAMAAMPATAFGQTTYHLQKDNSKTAGLLQLATTAPKPPVTALTVDLKSKAAGEYLVKAFDTPAGVPKLAGVIPAGSVVSFRLWMRKTATAAVMYPRAALRLNTATGQSICTATGTTALSTTVVSYTLTCTTASNVAMTTADRYYLWAGVNMTTAPGNTAVKAELSVEGVLNGNCDSQVIAPLPITPPTITSVSPASGVIGTSVVVTGANFATTQGTSTVTFGGTGSPVSAWSTSSITAVVPEGAVTGPVVVAVRGLPSNGVAFTVVEPPSMTGNITRAADGSPIAGASVAIVSAGSVVRTVTTSANGAYLIASLAAGPYEVRVGAPGYSSEVRTGVTVVRHATTTVNVGMSMPGSVSGSVAEIDGTTPIAGAAVTLFAGSTRVGDASTDVAGRYAIPSIRPGAYVVQAAAAGHRTREQPALVPENAVATANFGLASLPLGPVTYAYDAIGRLIQVTDSAGEYAVYRYDAVGNIVGIDRPNGSAAISGFFPAAGAPGTTVTIFGGGFDVDPTRNLVSFNGAAAVVLATSSTQLTTTVPAGATTGRISIATPAGSATSATSFTVAENGGRPTIAGFSPVIGVAGTPVTVMGSNFDAVPANDGVDLNARPVTVTAANATTLGVVVPASTMGGHVAVTTSFGRTESTSDFFVVPPPYGVADVAATDRMALGTSRVVTIGTSGKVGLVLFDAFDGQQISFIVSNSSISSGSITMYRPDGQFVTAFSPATNTFLDSLTLTVSGTYTLLIDPASTITGSLTLNSYTFADVTGTVASNGASVPVTITTPGQAALLTFTGAAGQLVTAAATSSAWTSCQFGGQYELAILNPDGSILANATNACGNTTVVEHKTLPISGTYTVRLNPYNTITGSASIAVYTFDDVTGPIATDGTPFPVAITAPGQIASVTFTGTPGQFVTVASTSSTWTSCQFGGQYGLTIYKPDGAPLASGGNACGTLTMLDHVALPVAGTYTIRIDPNGALTGSATLKAWMFSDLTVPITADGTPVSVSISTPGQLARLTFTGTAGQAVSAIVPSGTMFGTCFDTPYVFSLLSPSGSTLVDYRSCSVTAYLDRLTLPATGTYTLVVNPDGGHTGDATVQLFTMVDLTGAMPIDGVDRLLTFTTPGQLARFTFDGLAGQVVSAVASGSSLQNNCFSAAYRIAILRPDGSTLAEDWPCFNVSLSQKTLPANGTYFVVLDPLGANTGSIALKLTSP